MFVSVDHRLRKLVLLLIVCSAGSCGKSSSQLEEEERSDALSLINKQMVRPTSIEGQQANSIFIHDFYIPGLLRAKPAIQAATDFEELLVPVTGYVLSRGKTTYVGIIWFQGNHKTISVKVGDSSGILFSGTLPSSDSPYLKCNALFMMDLLDFSESPAEGDPQLHLIPRPIKRSTLYVDLGFDSSTMQRVDACDLGEATTRPD